MPFRFVAFTVDPSFGNSWVDLQVWDFPYRFEIFRLISFEWRVSLASSSFVCGHTVGIFGWPLLFGILVLVACLLGNLRAC